MQTAYERRMLGTDHKITRANIDHLEKQKNLIELLSIPVKLKIRIYETKKTLIEGKVFLDDLPSLVNGFALALLKYH